MLLSSDCFIFLLFFPYSFINYFIWFVLCFRQYLPGLPNIVHFPLHSMCILVKCIHYSTANVNRQLLLAHNDMKQEFNHELLSSVCYPQRTSSSIWHSLVHILNTLRRINYLDAIFKLCTPNNIYCDEFHCN